MKINEAEQCSCDLLSEFLTLHQQQQPGDKCFKLVSVVICFQNF